MAAAGTAGMVVAGGMAAGWNVIGLLAENLPWIGVAYHMLNEIADIVDTRNSMQVLYAIETCGDPQSRQSANENRRSRVDMTLFVSPVFRLAGAAPGLILRKCAPVVFILANRTNVLGWSLYGSLC